MALSEWLILKSDLHIKASIDYRSPIGGGGSLILSDNGVTTNPQCVLLRSLSEEKGFLSAKIRTLMRLDTVSGAGAGFVFMMDQENVTKDVGNFYGVFIGRTRTVGVVTGNTEIVVSKFYDGLQHTPNTILFYQTYNPVGVFAFEVEWISNLGTLGGTRIVIRRSDPAFDTADFTHISSPESTIYDDVDIDEPLLISRGEGIAYHNVSGGTNTFLLDHTSLTKIP